MKIKAKIYISIEILLLTIVLIFCVYYGYFYLKTLCVNKSWIKDLGYQKNEIHRLTFNNLSNRSCPEIPVRVGNNEYDLIFDTGCGSGIFFTDYIENKLSFTLLGQSESLNRDGSHRGWDKRVHINEISVLGDIYKDVVTNISDWKMYSSEKFNGTIGLKYFESKIITLDYMGHRIGVSSNPIDYSSLNPEQYTVLPLYKSTNSGQEFLPFFEAEHNGEPIMVYLDTGKNYSYINNEDSENTFYDKPKPKYSTELKIGSLVLELNKVAEVNDLAGASGLPYPIKIELNSDQIWMCNLIVTFDLIEQKIIFRKL